jgi:hypothetical protein
VVELKPDRKGWDPVVGEIHTILAAGREHSDDSPAAGIQEPDTQRPYGKDTAQIGREDTGGDKVDAPA